MKKKKLKKQIANLSIENAQFLTRLGELSENYNSLVSVNKRLSDVAKSSNDQFEQLIVKCEKLKAENEKLKKQPLENTSRVDNLKASNVKFTKEVVRLNEEICKLKQEKDSLRYEVQKAYASAQKDIEQSKICKEDRDKILIDIFEILQTDNPSVIEKYKKRYKYRIAKHIQKLEKEKLNNE
jgi:meiotically up-regulated gene 157 (Mug157) protein